MLTPHFESTLCVLLKVSGHFCADPVRLNQMVASWDIYANKKSISSVDSFWRYWSSMNSVI